MTDRQAEDNADVMHLVEQALARPEQQRDEFVARACGEDAVLLGRIRHYLRGSVRRSDSGPAFAPGELLDGRFRVLREVARGGMGIVYEAFDERLGRRIALKCAKAGYGQRLPPEVRHAREISHPNVCRIFEIHTASTDRGSLDFITMEFLEGETLSARLRRERIEYAEARAIARQLCAGLAEAHRNHVIHGDLKSNNVILTTGPDGSMRAVITDFGMARGAVVSQRTAESGLAGGTPDYMAPELWSGGTATVASDIYAMGVILFELACGQRPRQKAVEAESTQTLGTDAGAPAGSKREWMFRKPPPADPRWDRILARCLDPDPSRRFRSAVELSQALAPSRLRRRLLIASAAGLLAAAAAWATYERATAPSQTVRLALLPPTSDAATAAPGNELYQSAAAKLARLEGNARTAYSTIAADRVLASRASSADQARAGLSATHVLRVEIGPAQGGRIEVHAFLTDARSLVDLEDWQARYAPEQMAEAPAALAGVVSSGLHLAPLKDALELNPAARRDYDAGLAALRFDAGIDAALASFTRAISDQPGSALVYAELAEAQWYKYFATQDSVWVERASESLQESQARYPDTAPAHRVAGILEAFKGQYEPAEMNYARAIELEPQNGDNYRRLGRAYRESNQIDRALAEYRHAADVDPRNYRVQQELGSFYLERGINQEAQAYLAQAVALAPEEPNPRYALATAYTNLGRFEEAERELRRSLTLQATQNTEELLGKVLLYQRREQDAIPYLVQALNFQPGSDLTVLADLGVAYRRTGNAREFRSLYLRGRDLAQQSLARNPRDGGVRSRLAYFTSWLGEANRARAEIDQALQLAPNNSSDVLWYAALTYEALHQRPVTLALLKDAPAALLADLSRWPDVADLQKDSHFIQLLASHSH